MEPAKAPIANVWSMRKEQLAAARATSSTAAPPPAASSLSSSSQPGSSTTKPPLTSSPATRGQPKTVAATKVPPVTDKESWPEVTASLGKDANGNGKENDRGAKEQLPKKEKTKKWVPIPAEELQAAADALKASAPSTRRQSTGRGDGQTRKNPKGPPSQVASTSQSRVQSRSGSVQSSPRGAGRRRLPEEQRRGDRDSNSNAAHSPKVNGSRNLDTANASLRPPSLSNRSSKPGSPHPQMPSPNFQHPLPPRPHPYPQQQFPPYGPPPGFNASPYLPPPGADGFYYPQNQLYSTGPVPSDGGPSAKPVQFGSIDSQEPVMNGSRKVVIGLAPEELSEVVRGVKNLGITGGGGMTGKRSRRSSFAVPPEDEIKATTAESKGKWEFGTTATVDAPVEVEVEVEAEVEGDGKSLLDVVVEGSPGVARLSPLSMSLSASPGGLQVPLSLGGTPGADLADAPPPGLGLTQPQHPPGLTRPPVARSSPTPLINGSNGSDTLEAPLPEAPRPIPVVSDEDFEVRDYGYGFGRVSGSGRALEVMREEMLARERERVWEKERRAQGFAQGQGAHHLPPHPHPGFVPGRDDRRQRMPRPFEGGERERGDRDRPDGRGGQGPRRGGRTHASGMSGGGGPGTQHRHARRSNTPQSAPIQVQVPPVLPPFGPPHPNAPPLHMPPFLPPQFMHGLPLAHHGSMPLEGMPSPTAYFGGMPPGFMGQPNPGAVSYLPPLPPPPPIPPQLLPHPSSNPPSAISPSAAAGSGPPAPPVPVPVTLVPFPLDPTRYYLLGQLEYYLSPQNMAKDFFLRKKMDSRGWIPISIIASFNRVRRLTVDANIVREVLYLSSILQVRDDWVRMGGWEQFVLPDAEESVVPEANGNPMARSQMPPPMGMPLGGREPPVDVAPMYLMHNGVPVGPGTGLLPGFAAEVAAHQGGGVNGVGSGDGDEDEDDVLFVMTSDASR